MHCQFCLVMELDPFSGALYFHLNSYPVFSQHPRPSTEIVDVWLILTRVLLLANPQFNRYVQPKLNINHVWLILTI